MKKYPLVLVAAVAFAAGLWLRGGPPKADTSATESATAVTDWTCSMHPQIHQPKPGLCPLCGMDLIPAALGNSGAATGAREIELTEYARRLAGIATAPVERKFVEQTVRMVGKIAYDETRTRDIAVLADGVIERLFVNYVGVPVRAGDHLADLYSPDVYAAARELLIATEASAAPGVQEAARRKLLLLGVSDSQVEAIVRDREARKTYTIFSPINGVLTSMGGHQGHWLMRGEQLGEITDTSVVWALLDAYESDIGLIHYGQQVHLTVEALPGRTFTGFVSFIPPELDDMTRSVKVRLNVPNAEGELKPGMFVRAELKVLHAGAGIEIAPDLAGKWISPMHPEIVKDGPGECDICGMPLVTAESLGFIQPSSATSPPPLVIPATAPLLTGRRAVVYVAVPGREGTFEGREINLGPRAGDYYLVASGLAEGEQVVANGAMKIDSAIQILAKPSMMSAPDEPRAPAPAAWRDAVSSYLDLQGALAADHLEHARKTASALAARTKDSDWQEPREALAALASAKDLEAARGEFKRVSDLFLAAAAQYGGVDGPLYKVHCPMAFDDAGADWLQAGREVRNPYFGSEMLTCGAIQETYGIR